MFETKTRETRSLMARRQARRQRDRLDDEATFLRSWIERPLQTGAVMPSGRFLAKAMAEPVDPAGTGPVVELGPGTGPVTQALIAHGVDEARLVLVEYNPDFCALLHEKYPRATVVQGDAYGLKRTLDPVLTEKADAIVSSLPLLTRPLPVRLNLFAMALDLMKPGAPFVQFTYGVAPPIPTRAAGATAKGSQRIWLNIPPARVWTYRRG